jgi:protein transport protein SEC24
MPIMLEAVMRVRASRGLRMASFHGNFFVRSTDLLAMPAVPQDQSYAIEIQIEENITTPFVVFQTAVLHTTCYGMLLNSLLYRCGLTAVQVNGAFVS